MQKSEFIENAEEIEKEPWYRGPIKYILGVFLVLIIILMIIPSGVIKISPEPKNIPTLGEVLPPNIQLSNNTPQEYNKLVNPTDPIIKQIADKIAASSCAFSRVCQAKALYYFVRDNIKYVSDPIGEEYLEDPKEVLSTAAADCESGAILLAALEEAIGIDAQLVFIPKHAFVRINLPEARAKHKMEEDYVYLDWTCADCDFGEIPYNNIKSEKRVTDV